MQFLSAQLHVSNKRRTFNQIVQLLTYDYAFLILAIHSLIKISLSLGAEVFF